MSDETPDHIASALQQTCMLVKVKTTALGLTRTDKTASKKVAQDAQAIDGSTRVVANRLAGADEHHKTILAAQQSIRNAVIARTMRYGDEEGTRLLPNANFMALTADVSAARKLYDQAVADLVADAHNVLTRAKANLGFIDVTMPTVDDLVSAYTVAIDFNPVPSDAAFTDQVIPQAARMKLQKKVQKQIAEAFDKARRDTFERVQVPLKAFVERIEAYQARLDAGTKGAGAGVFRDTLVTNVQDIAGVLQTFNVTGDDRITQLGSRIEVIASATPEALRKDETLRRETHLAAQQALADIDEWLADVPTIATPKAA